MRRAGLEPAHPKKCPHNHDETERREGPKAITRGARVINMSFAGPYDPMLQVALKKAHDKGVILGDRTRRRNIRLQMRT
jgi:hypothetical protein